MTKKIIALFAILLLLGTPTITIAADTESVNEVSVDSVDFGTDSYDIDGCFC